MAKIQLIDLAKFADLAAIVHTQVPLLSSTSHTDDTARSFP